MSDISYKTEGKEVKVFLGSKLSGTIRESGTGYRYFPKGMSQGGEVYPTILMVKRSLEGE